jgi:hypothetical protein
VNRPARTRLAAAAALLAVGLPLVVVAALGGDAEEPDAAGVLRVERSRELPEVLLYVLDESANRRDRAKGRTSVTVECSDGAGRVLAAQKEPWPMTDTDGGTLAPHAHLRVDPARIGRVASCRVLGTDPVLEGPIS